MLEAEQRFAVARERIAIGDGAEEIDGRGAELDLAHLFLGERLWQSRLDGEAVAAGIDNALAALWRAPVEAVGHRIEHPAIGPVAHRVRRRLTEIADGAFDHRLLSGGDAGDEGLARAEIGAELHLGGVMRAGDEIARGEPQEDGGEQKEKREGSDDVVAVRGVELRQALPRALRHEDGGAVGLRRGSCGRGALRRGALFEAGLERGRGADEQNPDQEQDTEKDPGAQSEHPRRSDNSRRRLRYPEPRPRERLTAGGCGGNLKQSANRAACWRVESSRGNRDDNDRNQSLSRIRHRADAAMVAMVRRHLPDACRSSHSAALHAQHSWRPRRKLRWKKPSRRSTASLRAWAIRRPSHRAR